MHTSHRHAGRTLGAAFLALLIVTATGLTATAAAPPAGDVVRAEPARRIAGSYLVQLRPGQSPDLAARYGVRVARTLDGAVHGAVIEATPQQAELLAADPAVGRVEENQAIGLTPPAPTPSTRARSCGLDRIDQPQLPLDGRYSPTPGGGAGATIYLIDSGIDYRHPDLWPRARPGFDAFGGDGSDVLGNGTFMAGVIAGTRYGVANRANLVSVKVIDDAGGGTLDGLLSGIAWVTANAHKPAVVNFVIGLPASDIVDDAVRGAIASGVTFSIEAGADATDAGNGSPARVAEGIVVGASDCADHLAPFTNFGAGLDLFAPGVDITATTPGGGTGQMSGVQVAAAHVSGAAALYLGRHRTASPAQVEASLTGSAVVGVLAEVPVGTANRLLQIPR
jgi:subtilisin family serine protease